MVGRFLLVALVACGSSARPPVREAATPGRCGPAIAIARGLAAASGTVEDFAGQRVSRVELVGVPEALQREIRAALVVKAEAPLDREAVRRDLAMIERLEIADDVALVATPAGDRVAIRYELTPRGRLERVTIHGLEHRSLRLLRGLVGALDNPRRVESVTRHLEAQLRAEGYLEARLASRYVARGEVCTEGSLGKRYVIDRIEVPGGEAIAMVDLRNYLARRLTVNTVGGPYHEALLADAIEDLANEYRERGYATVRIERPQITVDRERARVAIRIPVTQGPRFTIAAIEWRGPIEPAGRAELRLARGDVFSPRVLRAAAGRVRTWAQPRDLSVAVEPEIDREHGRVTLAITVSKDIRVGH